MNLVLMTSTGDATHVVMNPAPNADTKWQGRLSDSSPIRRIRSFIKSYETSSHAFTMVVRAMLGAVPIMKKKLI